MANAVKTKKITKKKHIDKTVKTKQTASTFSLLNNIIKSVQAFIGFYAFFNVIFWLAYIAKIVEQSSWLYLLFKPAWNIVNIFYTYKSIEGKEQIDFTGVVCAICLVIISILLKSVSEFVTELEETAKIEDAKRLERAKKRAVAHASGVIKNRKTIKNNDAGFVFLFDISIKQVSGFIQEDVLSPEEVAKIKNNFFKSLLNNLNLNQVSQKGYYRKKLFLVYKSISNFDDFITYTRDTLNSLSKEFIRPSLRIDFIVEMSEICLDDDFKEKLDLLDTINKLNLKNEFICTQKLKDLYECMPKTSYIMTSKGVYNLSKNLNISNNQEIFSLREA